MKRSQPLKRGKPLARTAMKASRKPIPQRSDARREDADRQAEVRAVVFARDGHRCVVAPFARTILEWVQDGAGRCVVIPECGGRLEFGHRRHASAGGAYVPENGNAVCHQHNAWQEHYPDAARALGAETPWWLCVREGDDEWTQLGRRAQGVR